MTLDILLQYGNMLVEEQENVKRVQYAEEYLSGAALGNANIEDAGPIADRVKGSSFVAKQAAPVRQAAPVAEKPRESSFESSFAKQAEPPKESSWAKPAAPVAEKPKDFAFSSRAESDRLADRAKESYFGKQLRSLCQITLFLKGLVRTPWIDPAHL
jgi:hypothetical protein